MQSGVGSAISASVVRVHSARGTFKELSGILRKENVSLKLEGKFYVTCIKSTVAYGSEP